MPNEAGADVAGGPKEEIMRPRNKGPIMAKIVERLNTTKVPVNPKRTPSGDVL
jgi:hypothetical protein